MTNLKSMGSSVNFSLSLFRFPPLIDYFLILSYTSYELDHNYTVAVAPSAYHYDPEVFDSPFDYNPDRWLDEEKARLVTENKQLITFGYGDHVCLGMKFANVVVKTTLATLLKQYEIKLKNNKVAPSTGPPLPLECPLPWDQI